MLAVNTPRRKYAVFRYSRVRPTWIQQRPADGRRGRGRHARLRTRRHDRGRRRGHPPGESAFRRSQRCRRSRSRWTPTMVTAVPRTLSRANGTRSCVLPWGIGRIIPQRYRCHANHGSCKRMAGTYRFASTARSFEARNAAPQTIKPPDIRFTHTPLSLRIRPTV